MMELLSAVGMSGYRDVLRRNGVGDVAVLAGLDDEGVRRAGVEMVVHRRKLMRYLSGLPLAWHAACGARRDALAAAAAPAPAPPALPPPAILPPAAEEESASSPHSEHVEVLSCGTATQGGMAVAVQFKWGRVGQYLSPVTLSAGCHVIVEAPPDQPPGYDIGMVTVPQVAVAAAASKMVGRVLREASRDEAAQWTSDVVARERAAKECAQELLDVQQRQQMGAGRVSVVRAEWRFDNALLVLYVVPAPPIRESRITQLLGRQFKCTVRFEVYCVTSQQQDDCNRVSLRQTSPRPVPETPQDGKSTLCSPPAVPHPLRRGLDPLAHLDTPQEGTPQECGLSSSAGSSEIAPIHVA